MTSIDDDAFCFCSGLTSVVIPESVTFIGKGVFYGCGLTSVVSKIRTPFSLGSYAFDGIPSECTLTVPRGTRDAYIAAGWTEEIFGGGIVKAPYNPATDSYLSLYDAEARKGCSVVLPVDLHNSEAITAFQFELSLPEGVTLSDCRLTDRKKADHTVSYSRLANGNYKVMSYSATNRDFLGSEGTLLELALDVDDGVPADDYQVLVKNIVLTTPNELEIRTDDAHATLTVLGVNPADANGDGEITVTDVVVIVNYILGKREEGFHFAAADMNGDGEITVTDVVAVVNRILKGGASAKGRGTKTWLDPQ